ncbi:Osmotin, thaumatin-like protein [Meira miltonrushii]|uniref:Osmotin, thaumatin-like protein n=1 Tax=Meira miltonrushii TaxID=1280837 RepID=A0A316VBA6_9BASI|nr:Osmotin, thaumatin-like protein [Meira miltonrushii]PWN34554.1 Osmotin, thaumatin-like protein [Meira miltonrushii]
MIFSQIWFTVSLLIISTINFTSAYTIKFVNKCSYTVWPAIGAAPNGQPNNSIRFGDRLSPGCDGSGANCQAGACNGGLVCNDAGITSHAILSEFGYGSYDREYWDLSFVGGSVNIPTELHSSDGQTVICKDNNCPTNQAFHNPNDFQAVRSSPVGGTFTHTFCP